VVEAADAARAADPVVQAAHAAGRRQVGVGGGEPHVDVAEQRVRPLEAADRRVAARVVRGVGELARAVPLRPAQAADGQQRGVVGQGSDVQAGRAHRLERQGRIAVAVGHDGVVVQVGVDQAGALADRGGAQRPGGPGRLGSGGDRGGGGPRRPRGRGQQEQAAGAGDHGAAAQRRPAAGATVLMIIMLGHVNSGLLGR
jgi:hypothetical protein